MLVDHERTASLNLRFEDGIPQLLCWDSLTSTTFLLVLLVLLVQSLKLGRGDVMETRRLIRAEEGPFAISLQARHAI
jgi:hypothetical protein